MRIISGKYKGKRLIAPKRLPVRPTTDMAKEALFNILNNLYNFDGLRVLDLFAGTGNISFEFASRGTPEVVAVDKYPGCVKYISKISKELELPIKPVRSDVYKFLEKSQEKFDMIFADPPYNFTHSEFINIVDLIFEKDLLQDEGLLIVEHSNQTDLSQHSKFWEKRKYGGNIFSFFQKT